MAKASGHLIVSGRWDNCVSIINVDAALAVENNDTDHAILSRPRVTPDVDTDGDGRPDAPASGQPVAIAVDAQSRFAYVVNHSGAATPDAAGAYQHGHPGLIAVLDLENAVDPTHDQTLGAVVDFIPTGRTGPVGPALTPDGRHLLVNCGEAAGSEDGGNEVTVIDVATRAATGAIPLRENPEHPAAGPSGFDAPHPTFGRYPNPTGLVTSPLKGGLAFVGNGGFSDVSVIDLAAALAGSPDPEINRVGVETGPFGLAVSADGALVAVAARESMSEPYEGRTVSIIDVARAAEGGRDAEVARIQVGGDDPAIATRPFGVAFTPDGAHLVATCFRSNTISVIDVAAALAGRSSEVLRLRPPDPPGGEARPRGVVVVGRYACVIGGAKTGPRSSLIWLVDLESGQIAGTVTGVGNESYFLGAMR
jgi:DNA-binding beta-propeller fold protein YncE